MAVKIVNDNEINEIITNNKKVLVDCFATWCGPCKMLAPVIEEVSNELDEIVFLKLDIDENSETAEKYKVMSIPTLLYFEDGELKNTAVGFRTKEELKEILK